MSDHGNFLGRALVWNGGFSILAAGPFKWGVGKNFEVWLGMN